MKLKNKKARSDPAAVSDIPKRLTPSTVEELFRSAENWTDIRQIMVNVNYYIGNQWIGWNRAERRIQVLPQEAGVERATRNKIRPRVTTLLSKHTKNKLKYDVLPASKEQKDIDAAKAADKYLRFLWQELDFNQKTRDIFLNCLIKKRCWVKTWFDAEAGDDITPGEDDRGYEEWVKGGQKPVFTGVIRSRVCDALTVFCDPAATTEDEIRWIIERKATDVDDIFERYGVRVAPDANIDFLNAYDTTRLSGDGLGAYQTTSTKNMALLYELWMKPCKKYSNGVKITVAGGQELDYDENAGELPYQLFGYIPIPGTILYDALVTDMLAPQREINVIRSMVATHARRLGNSMWLNPVGSNVDEEDLVNEIAGIINYTPANNMKPERVQAPDIPSFYDRELANNAIDLDDMSGAREVSQGRMPAGLDTLGGLEIMVEQENEKLVVASQTYENGMKKVMQRILRLLKKHYTEERQARIIGEDNEIELISFNGSDLTGFEDINVVQGSSLPEMKAAQQERIMLMWKNGAIVKKDGMPDTTKLLRLMGMGDSTELFEQHQLDENNAKMENKTFEDMAESPEMMQLVQDYAAAFQQAMERLTQEKVPPDQWDQLLPPPPPGTPEIWDSDDDEVHIMIHNTFRKTSRYRSMPPELRILVDMHYQAHVDRLNAPMMEQQQAMEAQQAAKAEEANKNRQHQTQLKRMDQTANLERDALKAETAIMTAVAKGGAR
ncbi:hypothetical protein AB6A23_11165 [Paenibacillus tarimensis]